MLPRIRFLLFAAICALPYSPSRADETPAKLPKDGWWVRYFVTMKFEGRPDVTAKRTYSLVGTAVENGVRCRWVEMKSVQMSDGREITDVLKFLVPEEELLESERPLDSLVRCWRRFAEEPVEEVAFNVPLSVRGFAGSADFYWGRDFAFFPGLQKQAKGVRERRVVEYQKGRLDVEDAQTFQHVVSRRALTNGEKQEYCDEFTVWNDPAVAPAFVAASDRVRQRRDDALVRTLTIEFVLEDYGADAKSALPENN